MQWLLSNVTHDWLTWLGAHSDRWFTRTSRSLSLEALWAAAGRLAARVAHSTVAHSPEEPTLAECTEITTHIAGRFTVSPQGKAVSRRRRAFLHTIFVLRRREKQVWYMGSLCGGAARKGWWAIRIKIQSKCNSCVQTQELIQFPLSWKSQPISGSGNRCTQCSSKRSQDPRKHEQKKISYVKKCFAIGCRISQRSLCHLIIESLWMLYVTPTTWLLNYLCIIYSPTALRGVWISLLGVYRLKIKKG